jgi:hypothetical protein
MRKAIVLASALWTGGVIAADGPKDANPDKPISAVGVNRGVAKFRDDGARRLQRRHGPHPTRLDGETDWLIIERSEARNNLPVANRVGRAGRRSRP